MIEARRLQRSFGDGLIAEEIEDLRETWMQHVDVVLQDDAIVSAVYQALANRHRNSRSYGRLGFPADVVLRLLIVKHVRNWSYAVLEAALSVDLLSELKETAAPGFAALTEKQRTEVEEVSVMLTSNLEKITEHGKRADSIVKAMLEHSRGSSGERSERADR